MEIRSQTSQDQILVFKVGEGSHALLLESVEKVALATELIALPIAPVSIIGAVNWGGTILPVMSLRRRFHLPDRNMELADRFIIMTCNTRKIVLLVDSIEEVRTIVLAAITAAGTISEGLEPLAGTIQLEDETILIQDPDLFLSATEERLLEGL